MCRRWNSVDACFVGWTNVPVFVLLLGEREASATGSELHTDGSAFIKREIFRKKLRIFKRLASGSERERYSQRHVFQIFLI